MYLAQTINSQDVQTPLYINLLESILDKKDQNGKEKVDHAIRQASKIALKEEDIYSIDYKYYFFITTLLKDYFDGLIRLKNNEITTSTYSEILDIFR